MPYILDEDNIYDDNEINIVEIPTKILDIDRFNKLFYNELVKIKI